MFPSKMFLTNLPFVLTLIVACRALRYTDLGRRDSCEMPRLSFCAGVVDYKVPTSIARLSEYIELLLDQYSPALSGNEMGCTEPARRALCRQVFPACSEEKNTVTFEPYADCASQLMAGCSANTLENINRTVICSSRTFDLVGQSCRSLSDNDVQNLGTCSLPLSTIGSMELSDWMLHHIVVIGAFVVVDSLPNVINCFATHWHYLCSFGECNGDRIQSRINEEDCNGVMNCYSMDWNVVLPCDSLRVLVPTTTEGSPPTWPPIDIQTFDWSAASLSLSNLHLVFVLVLLTLWLLTIT